MKQRKIPYYVRLLIFHIIYLGLVIGILFAIDRPQSDAPIIVLGRFVGLLMFVGGYYILSFIYGLYFQSKHKLPISKIALMTGLVFILTTIGFWPIWQPNFSTDDVSNYYFFRQTAVQAGCFFIGSLLIKVKDYLVQKNKTNRI